MSHNHERDKRIYGEYTRDEFYQNGKAQYIPFIPTFYLNYIFNILYHTFRAINQTPNIYYLVFGISFLVSSISFVVIISKREYYGRSGLIAGIPALIIGVIGFAICLVVGCLLLLDFFTLVWR